MNFAVITRLNRALRDAVADLGDLTPRSRIRTLHHLSCTGGTAISKCIAAMPNVVLLSEINPLSMGGVCFNPRDPLQQFFARYQGMTEDELRRAFLSRLRPVVRYCADNGLSLVLRDHAHGDFLQKQIRRTVSLLAFSGSHYEVLPLITVRNPIDSYLSMLKAGMAGGVSDFDDYCRRVLLFAEHYANVPCFRHEDFVADPDAVLRDICRLYDLPFDACYRERFFAIELTGDSGRRSAEIAPRPRHNVSDALRREIDESVYFEKVAQRFCYTHLL